jgi:hypothetical protein
MDVVDGMVDGGVADEVNVRMGVEGWTGERATRSLFFTRDAERSK